MSLDSELDRFAGAVRAAAKECGALIIEAPLAADRETVPFVDVEGAAFAILVRHVKPRLVYMVAVPFDAAEELLDALEEADDSVLEIPEVKKAVAKWRKHDGQIGRIAAALVCDGVIHDMVEEAAWLTEFEGEIEELIEAIENGDDD